ncbi:hypothetical protein SAMN05444159_6920 [Bradyrhizobium lablabi]|uniref:Uncharacterized protein n=1 Tax=Bradyrhizobium lablabi TaxID=722472 RepID=A0A1M7DTW3_9BRAD|nr:hypothetical protein [Bradyrhizobium lablabi]SHL82609.1 hypothetical protein SAMN05444159_6920 [Bradyrhizobium lablabi]
MVVVPVGEIVGIVGTDERDPTLPVTGNTLGVGTTCAALTPRLPIPVESNGTPTRAAPLVMVDEVDVGFDDAARLLEPEPHIPVSPDVSTIPEDVASPDVAEIAVDVDIPDEVDVPDVAMLPEFAPVAGVAVPVAIANPPPS